MVALALMVTQSGKPKSVPMKDLTIRGSAVAETKEVRIVLEAGIGTMLGRVPIRGNTLLTYDCASAFTGKVSYSRWVRFFAKLKGVGLLTTMNGSVSIEDGPACPVLAAETIAGHAAVDTVQLSGWLMLDRDSLTFRGPAWVAGDTAYHSTLTAVHGGRRIEFRVNMYGR